MALVVNDRVKETSTTTGTGTFDLAERYRVLNRSLQVLEILILHIMLS